MGTIAILVAFLLAASANPIDDTSHYSSGESWNANVHDGSHSSPDAGPLDVAEVSGGSDTADPNEAPSNDLPASGGHDTNDNNGEPSPPNDMLTIPPEDGTATDGEDTAPSSVTTVSTISTEPHITTQASNVSYTGEDDSIKTGELDPSIEKENVTEPPDGDPSDCKNASVNGHINLLCTYMCGGDQVLVAENYTRCYLNQTQESTFGMNDTEVQIKAKYMKTGVCIGGECVSPTEAPTNSSETDTSTTSSPTPAPTGTPPTTTLSSITQETEQLYANTYRHEQVR